MLFLSKLFYGNCGIVLIKINAGFETRIVMVCILVPSRPSDRVREKNLNCAGFWGQIVLKNVDHAGNCVGLRNLVTNQIFNVQCSSQT